MTNSQSEGRNRPAVAGIAKAQELSKTGHSGGKIALEVNGR